VETDVAVEEAQVVDEDEEEDSMNMRMETIDFGIDTETKIEIETKIGIGRKDKVGTMTKREAMEGEICLISGDMMDR